MFWKSTHISLCWATLTLSLPILSPQSLGMGGSTHFQRTQSHVLGPANQLIHLPNCQGWLRVGHEIQRWPSVCWPKGGRYHLCLINGICIPGGVWVMWPHSREAENMKVCHFLFPISKQRGSPTLDQQISASAILESFQGCAKCNIQEIMPGAWQDPMVA